MALLYALAVLVYLAIGCVVAIFCIGEEPEKNRLLRAGSFAFYSFVWGPVALGMIGWLAVMAILEREPESDA